MEDSIEEEYTSPLTGAKYQIVLDDEGEEIYVLQNDIKIGSITLRLIEGDPPYIEDSFHITHLELDSCRRQGLGRRCLQLHKEVFNASITAGEAHGFRRDDGSHLTGDGPGFIAKMRAEGIVCYSDGFSIKSDDEGSF